MVPFGRRRGPRRWCLTMGDIVPLRRLSVRLPAGCWAREFAAADPAGQRELLVKRRSELLDDHVTWRFAGAGRHDRGSRHPSTCTQTSPAWPLRALADHAHHAADEEVDPQPAVIRLGCSLRAAKTQLNLPQDRRRPQDRRGPQTYPCHTSPAPDRRPDVLVRVLVPGGPSTPGFRARKSGRPPPILSLALVGLSSGPGTSDLESWDWGGPLPALRRGGPNIVAATLNEHQRLSVMRPGGH